MARRFDPVAYLKLFRFPLVFTAIADSVVGYLICTGTHQIEWATLACLAVGSAGLYFFGMGLNDLADRNRDKEIAPTRVLPSGRLSVTSATVAVVFALACSLTATLLIPDTSLLQRATVWGGVVLFICAYNLFLKIPPTMGLVRACNLLLGVVAARQITFDIAGQPWQYAMMAFPAFVYVTSLTYVSTLEDVGPSRLKLWLGAVGMILGVALAVCAGPAVEIWVYFKSAGEAFGNKGWATGFGAGLIMNIVRMSLGARDRKGVMLMVRDGVMSIIWVDATLLASFGETWIALAILALLIPAFLSISLFKRLA